MYRLAVRSEAVENALTIYDALDILREDQRQFDNAVTELERGETAICTNKCQRSTRPKPGKHSDKGY
jgi:hypothetical protein